MRYTRDANGIVLDNDTGLMWQDDVEGPMMNWKNAVIYSQNLTLGGYDDWRPPTIEELKTIVDYSRTNPSIDPIFQNVALNYYWSSTIYVGDSSGTWVVEFTDGSDFALYKSYNNYVRCVRDVQK